MKRIWLPTIAGMMGLTIAMYAVTAIVPNQPVIAQSVESTTDLFPILRNVNFTPEQEAQFSNLRQQTRAQISTIVSPKQQQQFQQSLLEGQGLRAAIASAQLTPNQREQVRQVLRSQRQQLASLITPAQRRQLLLNLRQF